MDAVELTSVRSFVRTYIRTYMRATRCEEESVERVYWYETSVNVKTALINSSEVPCYVLVGCTRHGFSSATSDMNLSRGLLYTHIVVSISRSLLQCNEFLIFVMYYDFCEQSIHTIDSFNHVEN